MSTIVTTNHSPLRILIAEDSPTQAKRLQHILEQRGYLVTVAANGQLALDAARRRKPTVVISDVVMPEMDGYELCRRLKEDPNLSDVPIILVTTLSDPQDVIRGLECRADQFILKPYDESYLLGRVQFALLNRDSGDDSPGMGLKIYFNGEQHFITADRLQILNLLLSTYEAAMQRNRELSSTQDTLRQTNSELQLLTRDLEDRVLKRTQELEETNAALRTSQQALREAYDDLRRTQQAAMQQERLRAVGQMASGVAHDINNAISPISLYTESLLETETGLSDRARGYLQTIQRAIDDVAQTVARMREFYRPRDSEGDLVNVDLNRLVEQVMQLTRARWNDEAQRRGIMIELSTQLNLELPDIMGSESEIRDALTNLIFNAIDAMPAGGRIVLRTDVTTNRDAEGAEVNQVCLEVSDTGMGMDEETRRRCLEPFFTTKGERGTGLGLAMVYGMAQRHSAGLEIESEVSRGTAMRLMFPVRAPRAEDTARVPVAQVPSRNLRILVVDDDSGLLESLRDTLQADGHVVTAMHGGQAGIDAFLRAQKGDTPFEVVITDLGMPYVDGRKVAEAVRAAAPKTSIVLLTGWGQRSFADDERPAQVDHLLSKPPRLQELRKVLAQCCN